MDLYKSKKVELPEPELYVIFAGERKLQPEEIRLSEEFFGGKETAMEVTVKVIYDGRKGDIINQYITFTKILDKQVKLYGRSEKTVKETIRICKDENALWEYLEKRESEVVDIMMQLYDQEEIMRVHDKGVAMCAAVEMCQIIGLPFADVVEKISEKFSLSKNRAKSDVRTVPTREIEKWKCF